MAITNTNSTFSSTSRVRKNQRATRGTTITTAETYTTIDINKRNQKNAVISPVLDAATTASSKRARVSVMIVPPIAVVAAGLLDSPSLFTIGYVTRVWEEIMLASKSATGMVISKRLI